MGLLDDLRVDLGDDEGAIPSGIFPVPTSGFPIGANTSPLSELRVDIGDDEGVIPSGTLASGIPIHNLMSPQHGDTTTASPSRGDLIIGGVSWRVLASGSNGQVLTVLGSDLGWGTIDVSGAISAAIVLHAADADAHHARYTDVEASGVAVQVATTGIANHTAISNAHHTRYTNAEAIAASSGALDHHVRYTDAEASGVAVQVTTSGIANHAAISGAHHPRYTDAEAIAASSGALDHHLRYTDAEASGVASGLISVHTAISGAHHPRYTDAEAIAAVTPLIPTGLLDVIILQESGVELTANATTTSVLPVTSTLLSVPIDLINPSGNLRILATAAINANGPVPVVFHIYINGVFYRGTTVNVTGAIDNASIVIPRVATSGVSQTVELRWAKFASPFVTVNCLPVALPNFYHASLSVQEIQ